MSTAEIACHSTPEQAGLRVETVPFDQIPQQSKLFLDYLRDPIALRKFYPEAVKHHYDLPSRRDRVLANYKTDRAMLCAALERLNRKWGAADKTLEHIKRLSEPDCIAVVSLGFCARQRVSGLAIQGAQSNQVVAAHALDRTTHQRLAIGA